MMKQKKLSDNETLFRLDCWMALHQRLCWLILACLAAVGVWLMTEVQNSALSDTVRTALLFAVMMGLGMAYRWSSAAPVRSLRKWSRRLEAGNAEQYRELLNYVLQDQGQALYESLSDKVKSQAKPEIFNGTLAQIESKMGKYQSHESWVIQEIQGMKAYTSMMSFEKGQLGLVVVYDEDGKVMGINLVPAKALKK